MNRIREATQHGEKKRNLGVAAKAASPNACDSPILIGGKIEAKHNWRSGSAYVFVLSARAALNSAICRRISAISRSRASWDIKSERSRCQLQ